MTFEEFDKFQKELFSEVGHMAGTKGKEYANSTNRFANFNRLATELGLKNYQVGWVFTRKHLDSIAYYCREGTTASTETIRGRFVDAICYLTLLAGMIDEASPRYRDGTIKDTRPPVANTDQELQAKYGEYGGVVQKKRWGD